MFYLYHVSIFAVAQAVAAGLAFLYTLIAARLLGVDEYGLFQSLMGVYGILTVFCIPMNVAALHGMGDSKEEDRPRVAGEFMVLSLVVSLVVVSLLLLISPWLRRLWHLGSVLPFLGVASVVLTTALLTTIYGVFQGMQQYEKFFTFRVLHAFLTLLCGTVLIWIGWGSLGAILGYTFAMGFLIVFFLSQKQLYEWPKRLEYVKKESKIILEILWVMALILFIDNAPMIAARIGMSETASGIYGSIYNLRNIFWPFAFAIALPLYSHMLSNPSARRSTIVKAIVLGGLLSLGFILAGFIFPIPIFHVLYGKDYLEGAAYMGFYGVALALEMGCLLFMFYQTVTKQLFLIPLAMTAVILVLLLTVFGKNLGGLIVCQVAAVILYFMLWGVFAGWRKKKA